MKIEQANQPQALRVEDHRRDAAGYKYVYPVLSRRAGGVSLGINLNVNNACNWACIYCQVPELVRGGPPPVDLVQMEAELRSLLDEIAAGHFAASDAQGIPARLVDVAFSGNGEPTAAAEFPAALDRVIAVLQEKDLLDELPIRLITNGSLMHRPAVQQAIRRLGAVSGEVWFKIDRATAAGMELVNQTVMTPEAVRERLALCMAAAPTWIQTCWMGIDGQSPAASELDAYVAFVASLADKIAGVHLYGIARPSMQASASRLTRLAPAEIEALAERLKAKGLTVSVSP